MTSRTRKHVVRAIKFLPLTFFAGIHGFGMFAPYAVVFLTAVMLIEHRRAVQVVVGL